MRHWCLLVGVTVAGCSDVLGLDGLVYEETSAASSAAGVGAAGGVAGDGGAGGGGTGGSTSIASSSSSSSANGGQATSYFDEVMADEPLAYWRLDGVVPSDALADAAASNDGTCVGSCEFGVPGALKSDPASTGMSFGAEGSKIEISDTDLFAFGKATPFTVELWARHAAQAPVGVELLLSRMHSGADPVGYSLYNESDSSPSHGARLYGDNGANGVVASAADEVALPSNEFTHMVLVYDLEFVVFYRNGKLQSNKGSLSADQDYLPDGPEVLAIGSRNGGDEFSGTIDEVAIYGAPLSEARIKAHYLAAGYTLP